MPAPAAAGGSYRAVLRLPFALRVFVPALGGRLAYGLLPLATLFTVQQTTGSYARAGLALAAFGLASITLPLKSRLTDRHGPRRVLPLLALACALLLAAAALTPWPVVFVALAGLAAPPLGPAMRSTWRTLTQGTALKERAYALDATAEETLYLVGPLLAGLLIGLAPARWSLLLTAALLLLGTLGMAAPRLPDSLAPPAGSRAVHWARRAFDPGPLRSAGLLRVLGVLLVTGAAINVGQTAMAAVAQSHGRPGAAGLLEAGLGAGSVLGGMLWARRRHTRPRSRHFAGLLAVLGAGLLAAAAAPGLLALGAVMSVAGMAIAPLYVIAYLAADDLAPAGHGTEAGTWINVAANAGSALGAAAAGVITDAAGPSPAFLGAGVLLMATAVGARWRGRTVYSRPA